MRPLTGAVQRKAIARRLAATMSTKNISRRLERLEEEIRPGEPEIVVLHVIGVTPDGGRVKGPEFKVETPRRTVKPGPR
jgi:hypothetical protein